ncbi:hypothetical protein [Pontibacter sp. G13]|uniref:hypothetical protein n=1 Tax=Pontibacter sp. G13 TaxID=3074898 RepID=UPI00288AA188|nr:hypothetical protein [Pontibacter sp. G13]WNJ18056.1 hypothetical protein RJD25_24635 [Pontibacter sp. G13]
MKRKRLFGIAILFLFLFNDPLLRLFCGDGMVMGIPVAFVSIFLLWIGLISMLIFLTERT